MIKVKDLHVRFKSEKGFVHAVRGVSFEVREKECVAIVGESGSGKSALAKSLIQLFPKRLVELSGEVIYKEKNLLEQSDKELRKVRGKEIAFIFQDPLTALNPLLSIGFQISEAYLRHHPEASKQEALKQAEELLEMVGIPEPRLRLKEYPHTLSGGTRQRALIALALAAKPKLLIADEPTTALDVTIQAQIIDLLKRLQEQLGMSILIITHDLSVVAGFSDKVMVMYGGEIVEEADVNSLFYTPRHPYTKRLLLSKPRLDMPQYEPLTPIEGSPPNLSKALKGCSFSPRCAHAMKICQTEMPPAFATKGGLSKCWLEKSRSEGGHEQ